MSTKDRILEVAIDLFAERGFGEVSIREITRAVGIKESSLYNHFASKQQILDEIFDYLKQQFDFMSIPEGEMLETLANSTPEAYIELNIQGFQAYVGNPLFMKIWRILSIERHKNQRAREMFNHHFIDEPIEFQTKVFGAMMDRGMVPRLDPKVLAREFYSYILYLYFRYMETDRSSTLDNNAELQQMVREHIEFLNFVFTKR